MQRLKDDRGAVAVIVAILMVPLLGFAAISLDVAATHAEKQQLQTGADAAALAIAQDCSRNTCGAPRSTAQSFATANSNSGAAVASVNPVPTAASGRVRVSNAAVRQHWFAPVLGVDSTDVSVSASAGWGSPTGGRAGLPLVFSWCDFKAQTGGGIPSGTTERTVFLPKKANTGCNGPSGNPVPGGFGWVRQDPSGSCQATSRIDGQLSSDNGNNQKCSTAQFTAIQNKTILLPISGSAGGNGANAWYRIYAYAAFKVTGYFFSPNAKWNGSGCSTSQYCIKGYFTQLHDRDPNFTYGPSAPNLGASAVYLLPD